MSMLCGAPSRLSKAIVNGVPAVTPTTGVVNAMSLATTMAVPPAGVCAPAEAGPAGVPAGAAEAPEQAASTAASASGPRVRVRRFMSVGLLVSMLLDGRGSGAGGDHAAARDELREGGEFAADDRDRAAVVADE